MMKIIACLILVCAYQVSALPAAVSSLAGSLQPAAALSSAQRLAASAAVLSSAERQVGLSIASKLDGFMKDASIQRPGRPVYNRDIDFELILDSSGSIGAADFRKAKDASKVIANYIDYRCPIGPSGSRVGLIEFSQPDKTHVEFSFGDYDDLCAVENAIDSVGYDNGYSTATRKALDLARTEFQQNGLYSNGRVAWILTDGQSNTGGSPFPAATRLKNMGVTICAVAIGGNVDMSEIRGIASYGCVYQLSSFNTYKNVMKFAIDHAGGDRYKCSRGGPSLNPDFFSGIDFGSL